MASERALPAVLAALLAALVSRPAEAAWINAAWEYRQPVLIGNSGGAASNVPVLIRFDSAARIFLGQMRSDCADLRVTKADQVSSLAHWVQSGCNTSSTRVWVRLNSLAAGTTQVYLYSGNPSADSLSDADAVFGFDASDPGAAYDYVNVISSTSLIEARTSAVDLANGDDVCSGVQMLGFDARFYGASVTSFTVNSNGAAYLSPSRCEITYSPSPTEWDKERFAASFWSDQTTSTPGAVVSDPGVYFDALSNKARITWMTTRYGTAADSLIHQVLLFSSGKVVLSIGDGTNLANFAVKGIGIAKGDRNRIDVSAEAALNRSWVFYLRKVMWPEPTVMIGDPERSGVYGYRFRERVSVTNDTGQTLTGYPVALTFDARALVPARMNTDCADFRVTDSDGVTLLSHWLESGCDSNAMKIWINVPTLPPGGRALQLHYGKYGDSTNSNADAVFGFDASDSKATYDYFRYDPPNSLFENPALLDSVIFGDDLCRGITPLGFDAHFYGVSLTSITFSSNGAAFFPPRECLTIGAPNVSHWSTERFAASFWADQRTDLVQQGGLSSDDGVYFDALSNKARITWNTTSFHTPRDYITHQVLLHSSGKVVLSIQDATSVVTYNRPAIGIADGTGRFIDVTAEKALNRSWVFYLRKTATPEPRAKLRPGDLSMFLPL